MESDVARQEPLPRLLLLLAPQDAPGALDGADDLIEDVREDGPDVFARDTRTVVHKVVPFAGCLFFVEGQDVAGIWLARRIWGAVKY